jgi:predicted RNA-binding Zn ribbon-like protein
LPPWVQPEETKPAPMPLLLVQAFVNTCDVENGTDVLLDREAARRWLGEAGLTGGDDLAGPDDLRLARDVRESIRALLVMNGGGATPDPEALRPLRTLTERCRLRAGVSEQGLVQLAPAELAPFEPAREDGGLAAALFGLVLIIRDAQADGTWQRLKACRNPECRWAFYDRSHSQHGAWCDMAVCGNRIKNRALRQRRK